MLALLVATAFAQPTLTAPEGATGPSTVQLSDGVGFGARVAAPPRKRSDNARRALPGLEGRRVHGRNALVEVGRANASDKNGTIIGLCVVGALVTTLTVFALYSAAQDIDLRIGLPVAG